MGVYNPERKVLTHMQIKMLRKLLESDNTAVPDSIRWIMDNAEQEARDSGFSMIHILRKYADSGVVYVRG